MDEKKVETAAVYRAVRTKGGWRACAIYAPDDVPVDGRTERKFLSAVVERDRAEAIAEQYGEWNRSGWVDLGSIRNRGDSDNIHYDHPLRTIFIGRVPVIRTSQDGGWYPIAIGGPEDGRIQNRIVRAVDGNAAIPDVLNIVEQIFDDEFESMEKLDPGFGAVVVTLPGMQRPDGRCINPDCKECYPEKENPADGHVENDLPSDPSHEDILKKLGIE